MGNVAEIVSPLFGGVEVVTNEVVRAMAMVVVGTIVHDVPRSRCQIIHIVSEGIKNVKS